MVTEASAHVNRKLRFTWALAIALLVLVAALGLLGSGALVDHVVGRHKLANGDSHPSLRLP